MFRLSGAVGNHRLQAANSHNDGLIMTNGRLSETAENYARCGLSRGLASSIRRPPPPVHVQREDQRGGSQDKEFREG